MIQAPTYEIALERAVARRKPRTPLTASSSLKRSQGSISRKQRPFKKVKAKRKKLTDGQLKKRVWTQFSVFIRTRGAGEDGFNTCVTCYVVKHWKELQAGHFIRGRLNANLFEEKACWPQCYSCNVGKQGNVVIYYKKMLEAFGQDEIDRLVAQNEITHKWQAGELANLLVKYKTLNAANPLIQEG